MRILAFTFFLLLLAGCSNAPTRPSPEAIETGRGFSEIDCKFRGYEVDSDASRACAERLLPFYAEQMRLARQRFQRVQNRMASKTALDCGPRCDVLRNPFLHIDIGSHPAGNAECIGLVVDRRCYGSALVNGPKIKICYGKWAADKCDGPFL